MFLPNYNTHIVNDGTDITEMGITWTVFQFQVVLSLSIVFAGSYFNRTCTDRSIHTHVGQGLRTWHMARRQHIAPTETVFCQRTNGTTVVHPRGTFWNGERMEQHMKNGSFIHSSTLLMHLPHTGTHCILTNSVVTTHPTYLTCPDL